ncbi:MAG TPA: SOS response-associated peptidase [Spirochaetia bacterium]|nr:SOS response-associated peptidase [Spirochaetia bacterium]
MCFLMSVTQESVYKQWGALLDEAGAEAGPLLETRAAEGAADGNASRLIVREELPTYYCATGFAHPLWPVVCGGARLGVELVRWGLVPFWVKDAEQARTMRKNTLNARSETIYQKPSFRSSMTRQRCLVLADGFFEPHKHDGKSYQFYCSLEGHEAFAFAGIYSVWKNPESGVSEKGFSIITTPSNELMSVVHNEKLRMPVILEHEDEGRWLDPRLPKEEVVEMLAPRDIPRLRAYTVSRSVSTRNADPNDPRSQDRVEYPELAHLRLG